MNRPLGATATAGAAALPAGSRAKVFISYSRRDLAFAQALVAELATRRFDAFLDKTDIAPGEPWKERLAGLIAAADTVVFVVSPDSAGSSICAWELDESSRRSKRVIPLVARSIADGTAPEALARLNYIFCTPSDDRQAALSALEQALNTDLDWVREHTRLSELARRWDERRRPKWAALRGNDLEAAERWLDRRPAEANAPTGLHQDFIRASRRAATGRQRTWVGGALLVAVVAVALAVFAEISRRDAQQQRALAETARKEAVTQRDRAEAARTEAVAQRQEAEAQKRNAERNFTAAKNAVDGLIFNVAQGLRDVGLPQETIRTILETVRRTVDGLLAAVPDDKRLLRSRAAMLSNFGDTYLVSGNLDGALAAYQEALTIDRKMATQYPGVVADQRAVSVGLEKVGDVKLRAGDQAGALAAYRESLGMRRERARQDPGNPQAQRDLSVGLERIGNVAMQTGDRAGALAAYQESLDIDRRLATQEPGDAEAQQSLALALGKLGNVKLRGGDYAGALAAHREALDIRRKLAASRPGDARAQRDVSLSLEKIGEARLRANDEHGALSVFQEGLEIARKLAAQDRTNARAQEDVSISLIKIGDVKLQTGDKAGAIAAYRESLGIARTIAANDRGNADALRQVMVNLNKFGEANLEAGDQPSALAAFEEGLIIARKLAAKEPDNAEAQRDLSVSLSKIGNARLQTGDRAGALAVYQEDLDITRRLAARDLGNAEAQWDLVGSLVKTAIASSDPLPLYREALSICQDLDRAGRLAPSRKFALEDLERRIAAAEARRRQ